MRIGIVCPYSLDRPGGVQLHVIDLAEALIHRGHQVSVLAPSATDDGLPGYVRSAGRSFSVHYNGSTARLTFGLVAAARVRRWMADGHFDVVHLHEPGAPSLSVIAMWARLGPTVGTFHTSNDASRLMRLGKPWIKPGFEELDARIAVSPSAARTVKEHLRVEATHIIPNGVDTSTYFEAKPREEWTGTADAPTIGILGRMDEPRKGLDDFLAAIPYVRERHLRARFLVAGRFSDRVAARIARAGGEVVGEVDEAQKASFMSSVDVYCAPNTGGESFGIVLVEAMAAGAAVVASDLVAFRDVATSDDGEECAAFFPVNEAEGLAAQVCALLDDPVGRAALAERGRVRAGTFDWHQVVPRIEETYRDAIRLDASFFPQRAKETPA
ncbi:glycosyltransferase family 4 protein [Demequina sp. TTPB684]|uniref:glycosyltransferase family 4 protein n=1 Tax=unclassified Demequina TaxID=2620311 RepID=UPI001CF5818E|nr:glycosyltransferase family 4 protein [Demequina sp. TMPB413]MCB2414085.1 glycosyltransferase family 4 protein [Demequina sp. TTPB684]UPU89204.1 glycosyltransferase family 4 protein [Demequina sp. TMPB413]